ncbi:hypothetical protein ABFS82_02G054300 [Erythranthe guttata]|uniref:Uncharacterized protein n=1 Tax=Erythranthe guttata TaxID=4155 RepID=A0A022PQ06_ERYGU|nr:PREDICTED: terpene synthase 10-like isoform X1 [Erythranthe guttata]EYU18417.1 hypothetical protein MIMGU_mgv1a003023mg [Erythranthe guttata]|eukprot:XP_012828394.1 PREDICTED: terpene synthase 10-like isoform X1 [Erythranthe guttata]
MCSIIMQLAISNKPVDCISSFSTRKHLKAWFVPSLVIKPNCSSLKCNAKAVCDDLVINPTVRRTGNYKPSLWGFDYLQSLNSKYKEERYLKRAFELTEQVKMVMEEQVMLMDFVHQLDFIDNLHRLNISYLFDREIEQILNSLYHNCYKYFHEKDLYSVALGFRLLRQHGFSVSQDVFDSFKNERGDSFKESLGDNMNTKGLLQLYEASFLMTCGEITLELARDFSTNLLRKILDDHDRIYDDDEGDVLLLMVRHALELPIHWRTPRLNARCFIDLYEKKSDMDPLVLELAKLDFNIVQAAHQQELKHVSSWWKETRLAEKLPFARDRVVESYILTIGEMFQPQYGYSRIMGTKVNSLVTVIDDMFDVYGTLEELQLFNDVIQRWDIGAIDQLPEYMQICFLALNNFVNEMAYDVLKQQGFLIIPYLRKSWADLCATYLQEAKWYWRGYKPTLEEYMSKAWISISVPVILSHAYFLVTNPIQKVGAQSLYDEDQLYHNVVRFSGTIARLANDLGTSPDEMERGDVPKAIQCYMNETGARREEAREYIRFLIYETWKKMNEERVITDSPLPRNLVRIAVDLGRIAHYIYQHGDGYGTQHCRVKNRFSDLLFEPIV